MLCRCFLYLARFSANRAMAHNAEASQLNLRIEDGSGA